MTEPKWTPGPWRLGDDATGKALTIWGATPGICITSVFDNRMGDDTPNIKEAAANARLIAAAPELYQMTELLERCIVYEIKRTEHDGDDEGARLKSFTLAEVRAVLAKARGEDGIAEGAEEG